MLLLLNKIGVVMGLFRHYFAVISLLSIFTAGCGEGFKLSEPKAVGLNLSSVAPELVKFSEDNKDLEVIGQAMGELAFKQMFSEFPIAVNNKSPEVFAQQSLQKTNSAIEAPHQYYELIYSKISGCSASFSFNDENFEITFELLSPCAIEGTYIVTFNGGIRLEDDDTLKNGRLYVNSQITDLELQNLLRIRSGRSEINFSWEDVIGDLYSENFSAKIRFRGEGSLVLRNGASEQASFTATAAVQAKSGRLTQVTQGTFITSARSYSVYAREVFRLNSEAELPIDFLNPIESEVRIDGRVVRYEDVPAILLPRS